MVFIAAGVSLTVRMVLLLQDVWISVVFQRMDWMQMVLRIIRILPVLQDIGGCKDLLDLDISSGIGFVRVPDTKMLKFAGEVKLFRRTPGFARRT